jgi:hypothetical protein
MGTTESSAEDLIFFICSDASSREWLVYEDVEVILIPLTAFLLQVGMTRMQPYKPTFPRFPVALRPASLASGVSDNGKLRAGLELEGG